jgi:hypothetical protein
MVPLMKKRKTFPIAPRETNYSGKRIRAEARRLKEAHEEEARRVAAANAAATAEGMQQGE